MTSRKDDANPSHLAVLPWWWPRLHQIPPHTIIPYQVGHNWGSVNPWLNSPLAEWDQLCPIYDSLSSSQLGGGLWRSGGFSTVLFPSIKLDHSPSSCSLIFICPSFLLSPPRCCPSDSLLSLLCTFMSDSVIIIIIDCPHEHAYEDWEFTRTSANQMLSTLAYPVLNGRTFVSPTNDDLMPPNVNMLDSWKWRSMHQRSTLLHTS